MDLELIQEDLEDINSQINEGFSKLLKKIHESEENLQFIPGMIDSIKEFENLLKQRFETREEISSLAEKIGRFGSILREYLPDTFEDELSELFTLFLLQVFP